MKFNDPWTFLFCLISILHFEYIGSTRYVDTLGRGTYVRKMGHSLHRTYVRRIIAGEIHNNIFKDLEHGFPFVGTFRERK